ncbi:MAG TPA: glucose-1-phosphate thymidylyltransferase RfbA [bacterium]|nr:glucose-1-phosphate thymidylyltransferase RfbA [bacterium]
MKGIILAGGKGTRLYPSTQIVCKQLLPVYDKPMIYYPLSTLMLAGIKDILIISSRENIPHFEILFGSGENLGLKISYAVQNEPKGIAEAFIIGEKFIGNDDVTLILGDNIFYGNNFQSILRNAFDNNHGATIFAYRVNNPEEFGVVEFDNSMNVLSLEEKPLKPKSKYAVVGLYIYRNGVSSIAEKLLPSARGELEITDLNKVYLKNSDLRVELFGRGFAWLDTGNADAMAEASLFIKTVEERQGLKIGCVEEIAYSKGFISKKDLGHIIDNMVKGPYCDYLKNVLTSTEDKDESF